MKTSFPGGKPENMPTKCLQCDRAFATKRALRQHWRNLPAHNTIFDCDKCDRAFDTEQALQQHQRDSPAHAKALNCDKCDRAFESEQALQQHLRDSAVQPGPQKLTRSMHPSLHKSVMRLLVTDNLSLGFHHADDSNTCLKSYNSNIMGRFVCRNRACSTNRWSSKMIAVTIRLYRGGRYNAVVWHQRCQNCNSLGQPILDDTYAERVAYRLKKWHDIKVEAPYYSRQSKAPHLSALCEGCKNGRCRQEV